MEQKNSLAEETKNVELQEKKAVLHTMKEDVETAIKKQEETLVSIALAEQQKKKAAREAAERAALIKAGEQKVIGNPRGRIFLVLVIILLALVGVGAYYISPYLSVPSFLQPSKNPEPLAQPTPIATTTPVAPLTPALIPTESEVAFSLKTQTPEQIFTAIASERTRGDTSSWRVKNIIINDTMTAADGTEKTTAISANRLLSLTESNVPEILARSLQNTFMAGFLNDPSSTIPTPFLILKVSGYSTSLSGLLSWESNLPRLFDTVFGTKIQEGLSAETKTRDVVILKHDSRVLEITPNVGIAYTFATPSTLVITASRTALETIIPLVK